MVRCGPLSDADVQRAIAQRFVPVVFDTCRILPYRAPDAGNVATEAGAPHRDGASEEDAELSAFLAIQRQDPLVKGIWITTPQGRVLQSSYQVTPGPFRRTVEAAVSQWEGICDGPPLPLGSAATHVPTPLESGDGMVPLVMHGRLLDGSDHEPFREVLMLTRDECRGLMPEIVGVGESVDVPEQLLHRVVTRFYPGEMRLALNRDEVKNVSAQVTVSEIEDGVAHGVIHGALEIDGVWIGTGRRRLYDASLAGSMQWNIDRRSLMQLEIVSDGMWQAEYPEGSKPGADLDIYPGGPGGRLVMSPPMRMMFLTELVPPTTDASSN